MKQLYIRCGRPTSQVGHWRLPWLENTLCGMRRNKMWNIVDGPYWPEATCKKCQSKRDTKVGLAVLTWEPRSE